MAETSGFFDAKLSGDVYDRVYKALDFAKLFSLFFKNGIFVNPSNNLQVVAKEGLTVTVKAGRAFIDGYWYELDEDMDITLSPNATNYAINTVIAYTLDKSERKITAQKRENVISALPVNDGVTHELVGAIITIPVGISTITDSMIQDVRSNSSYCGYVKGTVEEIDTTDLFIQFQTAFNEWFDSVKEVLDENTAGNLLNKITSLETQISAMPVIRSGTKAPDNSVGKDGDIYLQIVG